MPKNLKLDIVVDDKGSVKVKQFGRTVDRTMSKSTKSTDLLSKGFSGALTPAIISTTAAIASLGYGFAKATQLGMEFESTMKAVGAVSRASVSEYEQLESAARKMGATTEWSASQSAEALKFLAMAGMSVKDSVSALPGMLNLATAAQMDLGTASDIVTDTLTAFGMQTSELTRLSDAFINTSTRSNTTVQMLGESFKYVAPVAANFGYSVEETGALLGVLANSGIKASDAGTDLRQMMVRAGDAAKDMGIEGASLNETLLEMKKRGYDAGQVKEKFGMIALKSALVLMEEGEAVAKLTEELENNQGATEETAEIMRDSLGNEFKILQSTISGIAIDMFKIFSPELKKAIGTITLSLQDNKDVFIALAEKAEHFLRLFNEDFGTTRTERLKKELDEINQKLFVWRYNTKKLESDEGKAWKKRKAQIEWYIKGLEIEAAMLETAKKQTNDLSAAEIKRKKKTQKAGKEAVEETEKQNEAIVKSLENWFGSLEEIEDKLQGGLIEAEEELTDAQKKEIERRKKTIAAVYKFNLNHLKRFYDADTESMKNLTEYQEKQNKDRLSAYSQMYKDIGVESEASYEFSKKRLEDQAQNYKDMGIDIAVVNDWLKVKNKELWESNTLATGTFFEGMKIGFEQSQQDFNSWAEHGEDIAKHMTTEMSSTFSTMLFDGIKGDMDDLSTYWDSFMDSMLKKLTDTVADMAVQWGISAVDSAGTAAGWWSSGAWEVKKDHVAVVHKGEMIVPADVASIVRGGEGSPAVSDLAQVSPSGGHEWSAPVHAFAANPDSISGSTATTGLESVTGVTLSADESAMADAAMDAALPAATTSMVGTVAQGISLMDQGAITGSQFGKGLISHGIQDAVKGAIVGGIVGLVSEGLGTNTDVGNIGQGIGTLVGGSVLGPVGAAAGGIVGGLAAVGLADALDARGSLEAAFDVVESKAIADAQAEYGILKGFLVGVKRGYQISQAMEEAVDASIAQGNIDNSGAPEGFTGVAIGAAFGGAVGPPAGLGLSAPGPGGDIGTSAAASGMGVGDSSGGMGGTPGVGGLGGRAKGGIIDRLIVPGEDGLASVQFGEGVISRQGMKNLEKINEGDFSGNNNNRPINITIKVGNEEFDAYVGSIADDIRVEANRRELTTERIR